MRFWVELNDHVPDGQTVTSLLRFDTNESYSESMSGGKGVAAVTHRVTRYSISHILFNSQLE